MKPTYLTALALGALLTASAPRAAEACGGFFCSSQPMDQAGENVLFSVEADGSMTTVVQIFYQGTADAFAWVLPVEAVPQLGVGTNRLFQQLQSATDPVFTQSRAVHGTCRRPPVCAPRSYDGGFGGFADAFSGADAAAADGGSPGPTVYLREAVGPYDAVVLGGGTAQEILDWLRANHYDIPQSSLALIDSYLATNHVFVAIRLQTGRDTTEIQPLTLRYANAEPCVPIRLTAIATVPDLPIHVYVLASTGALPRNYGWFAPPFDESRLWGYPSYVSYESFVSDRVNAAGGQAFVLDYSAEVPSLSLALPPVSDLATITTPGPYIRALLAHGLQGEPLLLSLLTQFMPPPDGVTPQDYYNCLSRGFCSMWESYVAPGGFDAAALTAAIDRAIVTPRNEAQAMLSRHTRLTRMFTTMSAPEMTLDPLFSLTNSAPTVRRENTATLHVDCTPDYFEWSAPTRLELPSGRIVTGSAGTPDHRSDEEYCGGPVQTPDGGSTGNPTGLPGTSYAGGGPNCRCSAPGQGARVGRWSLGLAALLVLRRRRVARRRTRTAPRD